MSEGFTIRRYQPGDSERVWEIHERALRASPLEFVEDAPEDDLRNIGDAYLDDGGFLVGEIDGTVVAMGGFQPVDEQTVAVRRMRVDPSAQQQGYGRRLLQELERRIGKRGYEVVVLETNEQLRAARRLYETHGYEKTGREPIPATGDDLICYRKRLESG